MTFANLIVDSAPPSTRGVVHRWVFTNFPNFEVTFARHTGTASGRAGLSEGIVWDANGNNITDVFFKSHPANFGGTLVNLTTTQEDNILFTLESVVAMIEEKVGK